MEIEEAFTTEAIEAADTNVGGEHEARLREVIRAIYVNNDIEGMEAGDRHEDIAVLAFVAGRTYQADEATIRVPMSTDLLARFLEFLTTPEKE
jgi:hypothetical protein